MASHITSSSYSVVSQVVFSMAKIIHLVMSGWFIAANATMTNYCVNATNSNAKVTNSIAKAMNLIANGMNSTAKATNSTANGMNSTAKATNSTANGTKSIAKVMNSIVKTYIISQYRKF